MSGDFTIEATVRTDEGKGASRRLRQTGKIPGVIYGGHKDAVSISLEHNKILHSLEHEAFYTSILNVKVDGKTEKAILRDVQRHAYKPKVTHIDLQRVNPNDVIHMVVPLHFIGEDGCVGVKAGGHLTHNMSDLAISCAAKDLPEFIEVDVSNLAMEQVLHISDLKLPKGVTSVALSHGADHDLPVAAVHKRRGEEAEAAEEVEAEESDEISDAADASDAEGDK
ncbi:MAG: 50S ribosomal protein L25/general stress protein Ctc [Gammaproteobacteria bacterium]|nr:50S ribosomal protein L25/general stress protein Ctc [Gammaproteobacteria bacterium]